MSVVIVAPGYWTLLSLHTENKGKLFNHHPRKVVSVAYKRWSFKTGSNSKALTGKTLAFSNIIWRFNCNSFLELATEG